MWRSLRLRERAGSPLRNPVTLPVGETKMHCYSDTGRRGLNNTLQTLQAPRQQKMCQKMRAKEQAHFLGNRK